MFRMGGKINVIHPNLLINSKTLKRMTRKKKWSISVVVLIVLAVVGHGTLRWAWKYYGLPELPDRKNYNSVEERAEAALAFAKRHGMSERYAIFVDYRIPSGTPRLMVWDFKTKTVKTTTYAMHGSGGGSTAERPRFSNKPGSNCSSLGRFAVTKEHGSRLKRSFRIKGMDSDNQSAYARGLMIHPAVWVNRWCGKKYIPLNEVACRGCVTVASRGMDEIISLVKQEKKPLLLWNYYSL